MCKGNFLKMKANCEHCGIGRLIFLYCDIETNRVFDFWKCTRCGVIVKYEN